MKTGRRKPPAGTKQGVAKRKRQSLPGLMPLEPRVMYDAAGAHTAASHLVLDPHHSDVTHVADTTHTSQAGAPTHAADASTPSTPAPAVISPSTSSTPSVSSSSSGGSVVQPSGQAATGSPTIVAGNTISYTGNSIPELVDPNLLVGSGSSALVSGNVHFNIGTPSDILGFANGATTLNFGANGSISASYSISGGIGTLSLTGNDPFVADWQTALRDVVFASTVNDPTNSGATPTRTIHWLVTNSQGFSNSDNVTTIDVSPSHTSLSPGAAATPTYVELTSPPVALDSTLSITTTDTGFTSATISIGGFQSGDTLAVGNLAGLSASYNSATGVLVLSGSAGVGNYTTALDSITFSEAAGVDPTNSGANTTRSINWLVVDGTESSTLTTNLNTQHNATVAAGNTGVFLEGQTNAIQIEPFVTFGDTDTIKQVQLALPGSEALPTDTIGFVNGAGPLSTTITLTSGSTFGGIAGDGSKFQISRAGGTLTITALSIAVPGNNNIDFEAASREVAYLNNTDPTSFNSAFGVDARRDFIWNITDSNTAAGQNVFASGTRKADGTIIPTANDPSGANIGGSIISVFHKAPVIGASGTVTFTGASTPSPVVLDSGFTLADSDAIKNATVSIGSGFLAGDTLTFGAVAGATVGASTTSGGVVSETLTFTADNDQITAAYNTATGVLTLTETGAGTSTAAQEVADFQTALRGVEFTHSGDPTHGGSDTSRAISWVVVDQNAIGNNAKGVGSATSPPPAEPAGFGNTSSTGMSTVNTTSPGSLSAGALVTFVENQTPVLLDTGLTLSDVSTITSVAVAIGTGFVSGEDKLDLNANTNSFTSTTDGSVITASYSGGVLTLTTKSGTATAGDYQAALRLVEFSDPNGFDPTSNGTDTARTISWTVTDTSSSLSASSTVDTVHNPASVTSGGTGVTVTYTEQQTNPTATLLDSGLAFTDTDNLVSATVSVANFQTGDQLSLGTVAGATASAVVTNAAGLVVSETLTFSDGPVNVQIDETHGTLTLSNSAKASDYQAILDTLAFNEAANSDPTHGGGDNVRNVSWKLIDANSNTAANSTTFTSTLDTVHKAPVVTAGATAAFTEGSTPVVADGTLTVTDSDSIKSATVSITGGLLTGDTLDLNGTNSFTSATDGSVISASYSNGLLTLTTTSGTATSGDYQAALELVHFGHAGDPTGAGTDPTRTLTWTVVDTNTLTAENTSQPVTSTINVTHNPPILTGGGTGVVVTYTEQQTNPTTTLLDSGLAFNDTDNLVNATVSVSSFQTGDVLSVGNLDGLTLTSNANGTIVLSGTAAASVYQTALDS
ncbi:MAG: hypothetical protein JO216_02035, partial [Hyphomicrobiales bacterium]|nr:hypothetical protein [Hyphomicrobiales bacterium]